MDETININKHKYIYICVWINYIYIYIYIFKYLSRTWHYGTSSWSSSGSLVMASLQTMIVEGRKTSDGKRFITACHSSSGILVQTPEISWALELGRGRHAGYFKLHYGGRETKQDMEHHKNMFKYMCNYVFWSHWPDSPEVPLLQEGVLYSVVHSTLPPVCSESKGSSLAHSLGGFSMSVWGRGHYMKRQELAQCCKVVELLWQEAGLLCHDLAPLKPRHQDLTPKPGLMWNSLNMW